MKQYSQHFWYIAYSIFFLVVAVAMLRSLFIVNSTLPTAISLFDLVIMILATFRITRLFVYDQITFFIRDMLQHGEETYTQEGATYVRKVKRTGGPLRTAYELVTCPWCFSIWASLLVAYSYFLNKDIFWLPILIFAISGAATSLQILINMFGWIAENRKLDAGQKSPV